MHFKKNVSKVIIISVLCVLELSTIYLMWKSSNTVNNNSSALLENNNVKEKSDGNLAIMLGDKNNNNYTESDSGDFPSVDKYIFNSEKSSCINASGNTLDDSVTYSNGMITIKSNATSYCYLYFDYVSLTDCSGTIGECLMDNPTLGLNTSLEGGLYRYQGEAGNVNNFVCFGTTSKEECLSDTDKYMYRVMGINENNQVKLIKKEALNTAYAWHSSYSTDIHWPDCDLYKGLNGSYFLDTIYVPSGWNSKIANIDWKYGDILDANISALSIYNNENSWGNSVSTKIGLSYLSDYYFSYQSNGLNCSLGAEQYSVCGKSWMYLANNDSNSITSADWNINRYGYHTEFGTRLSWVIYRDGSVRISNFNNKFSVRPTFFLTSDMQYKSGTGTIDSPIILDTNPLVVNSVTASETTSSSITLNITTSDNELVDTYYYKCGDSVEFLESTTNTPTCSGLTVGTSYNFSVYVKDKFGHTSETKTVSLKTKDNAGNYVLNTLKPNGLNTTMEGGLYRFQGTNDTVNNYICFGTSDKETCTGNTDAYMYRIIGINEDRQLKLIKKEALNERMQWVIDNTTNKPWPNSDIKANINGSGFLSNTTYVPSSWSDKIATTTWKYGDNTTENTTAASLYSIENGWTETTSAKIGLMYMHDYYYAYQSGGLNCSYSGGNYSTCKNAWIFLGNNDLGAPTSYEWTMSRYGYDSFHRLYNVWYLDPRGDIIQIISNNVFAVRPVFFLNANVQYSSGTGTLADPILIS